MEPHLTPTHLVVSSSVRLLLSDLVVETSTPGGPGGQHANRTESKVTVKADLQTIAGFGPFQRQRVMEKLGPVAKASAAESRSQARNRVQALERLGELLAEGLKIDPLRRPTKPTKASGKRRVDAKQRRGAVKQNRRRPGVDD
jgi:ribosome-associated protein